MLMDLKYDLVSYRRRATYDHLSYQQASVRAAKRPFKRVIIELKTFLQFWHYTFGNVGMSAKYWLTDFHKKVKLDLYLII